MAPESISRQSWSPVLLLLAPPLASLPKSGIDRQSDYMQRRQWYSTTVLLPGKSHGRRSLVGCSPWGLEESDTTEWLHFDFSLSCIGEGNGNPLQCSCLENLRVGGAWWAAIYGVAQSRTRLKWLSSSSRLHAAGSCYKQRCSEHLFSGIFGFCLLTFKKHWEKETGEFIILLRIPVNSPRPSLRSF